MDVREVQLAPNSYTLIVAATILDHLTREEDKRVAESMISALKPGGFIRVSQQSLTLRIKNEKRELDRYWRSHF